MIDCIIIHVYQQEVYGDFNIEHNMINTNLNNTSNVYYIMYHR